MLKLRPINWLGVDPAHREKYPDYSVMQGGWQVGRIYRRQTATDPEREWLWVINGVQGRPEVMQTGGACSSLDQAKVQLNANWEKWLAWAKLSPQPD